MKRGQDSFIGLVFLWSEKRVLTPFVSFPFVSFRLPRLEEVCLREISFVGQVELFTHLPDDFAGISSGLAVVHVVD